MLQDSSPEKIKALMRNIEGARRATTLIVIGTFVRLILSRLGWTYVYMLAARQRGSSQNSYGWKCIMTAKLQSFIFCIKKLSQGSTPEVTWNFAQHPPPEVAPRALRRLRSCVVVDFLK